MHRHLSSSNRIKVKMYFLILLKWKKDLYVIFPKQKQYCFAKFTLHQIIVVPVFVNGLNDCFHKLSMLLFLFAAYTIIKELICSLVKFVFSGEEKKNVGKVLKSFCDHSVLNFPTANQCHSILNRLWEQPSQGTTRAGSLTHCGYFLVFLFVTMSESGSMESSHCLPSAQ